ncbi:O-antigen ligase family protein [Limibacillus halophilus]
MSGLQRPFGVAWPLVLFLAGLVMPPEASLNLGGLRLSGYRVVLILTLLPCLLMLFTGRKGRLNIADGLIILHCIWAVLALIRQAGLGQGIESGGIYAVECLGAYLLGRLYIRSYEDFYRFSRLLVGLILALLLFTLPEALTGKHLLRDLFRAVLGGPGAHYIDPRMGLTRAFGPFDHPILYGVFSAVGFSLAFYVLAEAKLLPVKRLMPAAGVALATFLSLSGGPFVALAMQIGIIGWERATQGIRFRWLGLLGIFACVYIAISLLSNRNPILVFISYLTFSTRSAYNRVLIWDYGTAEIGRHPLFGIGLADWIRAPWMSDSMDNFWLVTAVRYGLPAFALLAATLCILVIRVAGRKGCAPEILRARRAWGFTLFGLALAGCTVHLWNALFVLFFLILGSGAWILETSTRTASYKAPPAQVQRIGRKSFPAPSHAPATARPGTLF